MGNNAVTGHTGTGNTGEFDLIARLFAPLTKDYTGAFNLTDDCASYTPAPGYDLVLTKDTIVSGVHFLDDNPPASIARKALGVNLSDLAAKGAEPKVYLLSIALPKTKDFAWIEAFASGLRDMQKAYNIHLAGGDTVSTPGSLTISITAIGQVPQGRMVLRNGARAGDILYVTGTIGDSYLGLQQFLGNLVYNSESLKDRYLHPQPRCPLSDALRQYATAAMDISDGLIADLGKLCKASDVGAGVTLAAIPLSVDATEILAQDQSSLANLITGGDDYEILAAISPDNAELYEQAAKATGIQVRAIGVFTAEKGVRALDEKGAVVSLQRSGFDHFK